VRSLRSPIALLDLAFVLIGLVLYSVLCGSQDQTTPSQRSTEGTSSEFCCIRMGDELQISVGGEPDLSRSVVVGANNPPCGMITRYERFTMLWGAFSSNAGLLPYARS
jgi:hypothetical protein